MKVSQNDATTTLSSHVYFDALPLLSTWLTPLAFAFSLQEKTWRDAALFPYTEQPYPKGAFPLLI